MAEIRLDFLIDDAAMQDDRQSSPATAPAAALEETYFVTPFRFSINDVELLGVDGRTELPLPLLGFATHLHLAAQNTRAEETRRCYLAGGGHLELERKDGTLRVSSSLAGKTVVVDAVELLEASRSLLARARDALIERVPEMQAHPNWAQWFAAVKPAQS